MPNDLPVFDIRVRTPYLEGNPLTRSEFDRACQIINRTVFLIGDLPFQKLFTQPLSEVIQHISVAASNTAEFSLLQETDSVVALQEVLRSLTRALLTLDAQTQEETLPHPLSVAIDVLRAQGILLPDFRDNSAVKQAALASLLASPVAAALTYRDLFDKARADFEQQPEALDALSGARKVGVLEVEPNGMCCSDENKCQTGKPTDFCAGAPNQQCGLGSYQCPAIG